MSLKLKVILVMVIVSVLIFSVDSKKKSKVKKSGKGMLLREKETNPVNFIRLAVMRLIYGVATRVGFGEQISEALNGAFVPPGVDEYDDYGEDGLFAREDYSDEDYDY
ncbi:uncharacterized protein LOC126750451 [Anthonomus grandis grandis]|uniref:uncharacterized protein LOC126750451 n=1 Tax=Anthonomus grandis grandis TaxID=2921223 RepID=UPI0021650457|nr:uncharacterized protein LOC126750451 [Anthonomus grandis grandis]